MAASEETPRLRLAEPAAALPHASVVPEGGRHSLTARNHKTA